MPIHDWMCVPPGIWHAFTVGWVSELSRFLNNGGLPRPFYSLIEPQADADLANVELFGDVPNGGINAATNPPKARLIAEVEPDRYVYKRRTIVIRHESGDREIARIELVPPGIKANRRAFRTFVDKVTDGMGRGVHLLIVDLFPPTRRDPDGLHAEIWEEISPNAPRYRLPAEAPLALMAYSCGPVIKAYLEATTVGWPLIDMPLFLEPAIYINVPLEETYRIAYAGMPRVVRDVLESPESLRICGG